jgi:hypothetical protein
MRPGLPHTSSRRTHRNSIYWAGSRHVESSILRHYIYSIRKSLLSWPSLRLTPLLQFFWISESTYFALIGFIKIQFLLFYLHIFPDKNFRRVVWGVIAFNLTSMIAFVFSSIFLCSPVSFAWTQWDGEHHGTCNNNNSLSYANASISILLDFVALSLPLPQIWRLQLSLRKKIGVLLMFSVGAL